MGRHLEISIQKDEDGHTYLIPRHLVEKFQKELDYAYETENYTHFLLLFEDYLIDNPDSVKLYVNLQELADDPYLKPLFSHLKKYDARS